MPLIAAPLVDYTDKDLTSIRRRLRNLVTSVFPEWTDFNEANFGNLQLELMAHVMDVLLFYQDAQARQGRVVTATQRRALIGALKLLNYNPATATAATADVVLTLTAPTAGDLPIPRGTVIQTEEITGAVRYQVLTDHVIPAGSLSVTVSAQHSETRTENFIFNGRPNQQILLGATPFLDGTEIVIAGNGEYERVKNFLNSKGDDRHYVVSVDQGDRATIKFGNGVNGAAPTNGGSVEYRIGGGVAGRVEATKLRVLEQSTWRDTLGNTATLTATNPLASSGGNDRESVAQMKEKGPASLEALTRSIASPDYETNAMRDLPDVARALFLTSNEDPGIDENSGELFIIPSAGLYPSSDLKDKVLTAVTVTYPCPTTFRVDVRDPVYRVIDVSAIVFFSSARKTTELRRITAAEIRTNLAAFFAVLNPDKSKNARIDFGGRIKNADGDIVSELAHTDVLNVVRDTTGVRKLDASTFLLNGAAVDVALTLKEFPRLGSVTITDGDTGADL